MHLWPLLALIRNGVNTAAYVPFKEQDDRNFWDKFMRLSDETRPASVSGVFTPDYYIEPLARQLKPGDYPHRSPSSIRVRTFKNSWHAAQFDAAKEEWKLVPDFASIVVDRALSKGGVPVRVPVVDIAAFLFREDEFGDDADAATLESAFRATFPFIQSDYDKLFVFKSEPAEVLYTDTEPTPSELNSAIHETLITTELPVLTKGNTPAAERLDDNDPIFIDVKRLLDLSSSGVIFRGCPGTGKTWYAKQIAQKLVADSDTDIFQVQFHPSYGYEDFVEGYRPDPDSKSGFGIVDRVFLDAIGRAERIETPVVFIIDEINRGDPARAFGELLTYIEHGYREVAFPTALSGKMISVPSNLIVFGTMNPFDRSTTQFDMALTRRFDHIDISPDPEMVEYFLASNDAAATDFDAQRVTRIARWFSDLQQMLSEVGIGHTYFKDVKTLEDLRTIWKFRMFPYCESILELNETRLANVKNSFDTMILAIDAPAGESEE
jgi:5-methylcytosine-specific restriction enzyme B